MEGTAKHKAITVVLSCNSGSQQEATLPDGISSVDRLVEFVRSTFKQPHQALTITDGQKNISCDEDVQQLQRGQRLLVRLGEEAEQAVFKERISFNPHPKTLTMAGDYEYFAAQGHHPLAFALAELIDNALRATKGNREQLRSIVVSLVTDDKGANGMVCVRDNGSGMTVQELNNWAVMNLSMEDRGLLNAEEGKTGNRYLSSDISYFGVGSKNAAFYLGKTVKVVTKTSDSSYVHELCIKAAELERRYREGQAVYEEEMLHRQPGDGCSLEPCEHDFLQPQQMLQQEVTSVDDGSPASSFTRILIYDLKPDVLGQLCDDHEGASILRDLAHLYHYYLHGAKGNTHTTTHASELPNGERVPEILVERLQGSVGCWRKTLVEVDDDLESRYLKMKRAEMEFVLSVPNHGKVEGVLWYFPYENDQETVPLDAHTMGRMMLTANRDGATQQQHGPLTQAGPSQAAWQSQAQKGTQAGAKHNEQEAEMDGYPSVLPACPTFEAFWQGRLIPGACVDTLPFIRAVQSKRTAAAKDLLPDEVFSRIRGALFFGPGFRVTRNKLTFRDNLALLLESASPTNRNLEKQFKEWLINCHRSLDRSVRFEVLCHQSAQSHARKHLGQEFTIFERMSDGVQTISKGDVIRLNCKPAVLGRVVHFSIPQVVQTEGCYSGGRVTVTALPTEVLGADNLHTWPLRRLEGLVSQEELQEHVGRELSKLPAVLRFEPMKLAAGGVATLSAGTSLPETSISVVNGAGNKIMKALMGGQRQQLKVVQTLYYLGPSGTGRKRTAAAAAAAQAASSGAADAEPAAAPAADEAGSKKGGKRNGKRRKKGATDAGDGAAADKENEQPAAAAPGGGKQASPAPADPAEMQDDSVPDGEVLVSVENKSPIHDTFQFQRITGGLTRAGCYCLQYSLVPELPGGRTLRFTVDLQVTPGPAVSFDVRGEGRAIALSKSLMLGEALPPLCLLLQDSHGNAVPAAAWEERQVQLQVLQGSTPGGGAVLEELNVMADMEVQQDELRLTNLRVLGPPNPAPGSTGMQLFKLPAASAASASGADGAASSRASAATRAQRSGGAGQAVTLPIVRAVDVFLAAHVEGMPLQGFPVRLAPGAPHSLRLLNGHPFCTRESEDGQQDDEQLQQPLLTQLAPEQQLVPAEVMSGEQLPTFKVQTLDVWGNATCPNDALPFEVALKCAAAEPAEATFSVDDRGVAVISGVSMHRQGPPTAEAADGSSPPHHADAGADQQHELLLWPQCSDCEQPLLQQAVQVAQPQHQMALQLLVQPSTRPAELLMTYQGEELGRRVEEAADGSEGSLIWQLTGVEAGSAVQGLAVRCVDEVGRPAAGGVRGKIQVSWAKGSKKAVLGGDEIRLPSLPAPDTVGGAVPFWVRFIGDAKEWPDVSLDIQFEVSVVPGHPASWSVAIVDYQKGAAAAGKPTEAGSSDDLSSIPCGKPFYLEIEALDRCNNRCCFGNVAERPVPVVVAEAEDPEAQLQLDPDAWQHKWDNTQAGGDVCLFKLWLSGPAGPVKLLVRDKAGEDGASLLAPDELLIELLPGPPAALVADCAQQLECGTRGLLEVLPVKAVDSYGNLVESSAFEVALNGSAFNNEGVAARVVAAGSNRAKLRNGVAAFKNIRVAAQAEGVYKLTVGSVSRKIAVQEATVMVKVAQQNFVTNLEILAASLPADGSTAAGSTLLLLVVLDTEDQQVLPWEALSSSLSLSLTPPTEAGGSAAAAGGKGGKAGKGGSGSSSKAEVLVLSPERVLNSELEGLQPAAAEAAAAALSRGCVVCFSTPELTVAGQYVATAQYTESRPQLLPGLTKQEQSLRSTSLQFQLSAGPVSAAVLQAAEADRETLTISNGKEQGHRRLLRNAVVQLQDSHANPAAVEDIPVRWRLLVSDADSSAEGAEAPQLCCSAGELQLNSDARGRAFFGDIAVEQGTGCMPPGASQALQLTLEVQVLMPKAKNKRISSASSNWVTIWHRPVLFADDAARIRELQCLQEQREQLQQRLEAVKESVQEVRQRLDSAEQDHQAACKAAGNQLQRLREKLNRPDLQLPASSSDAQQLLQQIRAQAAQEPAKPELKARYGGSRQAMTLAIQKLLQMGDPELVGVFAQLGYVDEPRLSAVLAANYCAAMQVVIVKSYDAITRLRQAAQRAQVAIPSMLSYTLIQEYTPDAAAAGGGLEMRGMSELAQRCLADACQGTDGPLPIPLPHTRQICLMQHSKRRVPPGLPANQWPDGCIGYAVNLIRPAISNTRKGLMYAQVGRTLVFETIDQAAAYRHYVVNVLSSTTADIVTLDEGKLSGRGVVVGSNFRVTNIHDAPFRFGTVPAGQQVNSQTSLTQCEAAAEAAIEALHQQEAAIQELQEAQAALQQPQHQELEQQQALLQQQLQGLQQQIKQQQRSIEGDRKRAGRSAQHTQVAAAEEAAHAEVDLTGGDGAADRQEGRQQRSKRRRV